ncbi:MAG: WHG domain-containing protein [Erysipelotrichia bacterium]|nr:WHG domain-containing protein [Erysipelotrichia bacterium]
MPRNYLFTKGQIVEIGLQLIREKGMTALTARALGEKMGTSSKPIFSLFKNMEELKEEILVSADNLYQMYLQREMTAGKYSPYKASGMAYIRFAREEKHLFELLFMRNRSQEEIKSGKELKQIISIISESTGMSKKTAELFHLQMWIYVHGIATMIVTSYLNFEEAIISQMLSDIYNSLRLYYSDMNNTKVTEDVWKQ